MMIFGELRDLVSKEKRRTAQARANRGFALGVGIAGAAGVAAGVLLAPKSGRATRETIKDSVKKRVETVKGDIKAAVEKSDAVRDDIREGAHEVALSIQKTAHDVSGELNTAAK